MLGLIGGLGPESTVDYYQRLIAAYQRRHGENTYPQILIDSVDLHRVVARMNANEHDLLAADLAREFDRLAAAGATVGAITANTPHIVFDAVEKLSPIPLVSIVRATCDEVARRRYRKPLLLGTRFTMQGKFYPENLVRPPASEHDAIHDKYMNELVRGTFSDATRRWFVELIERMRDREHVDAVILAGTELPLLLRGESIGVPMLDTTEIHVEALVAHA